jgi:hypothetical protein
MKKLKQREPFPLYSTQKERFFFSGDANSLPEFRRAIRIFKIGGSETSAPYCKNEIALSIAACKPAAFFPPAVA